jgi:Tfp pilus assembly protein PilF
MPEGRLTSDSPVGRHRFGSLWRLALVALVALLCYANTFSAPFQFDDEANITGNPIVNDWSYFADTAKAAGLERQGALRSRYVGFLTFFLNYRANGLDVTGFHVVNILIHILTAWLVYALVALSFRTPALRDSRLAGKARWIALLTAVLFAAHPVNTQAVTYIVQRLASLAAMFYLGSMVSYIRARLAGGRGRWFFYAGALVLAVLAMKTKENAFTLPVAVGLYEFLFFAGDRKRRALLLLPLALTMLIIPLTLIDIGKPVSEVMADVAEKTAVQQMGRGEYLTTELRVMATYARLLVLPVNQNLDYDYPIHRSLFDGPVILSFLMVAVLLALAVHLMRRAGAARLAGYGVAFFFIALSVESTLVPLQPMFEHRLYLPGVGGLLAFSVGGVWVYDRLASPGAKKMLAAACVLAVVVLGALTMERNTVWQSETGMWEDVVAKSPENARGQFNLGFSYGLNGQLDKAIEHLRASARLQPGRADTYYHLGVAYDAKGQFDTAIRYYQLALQSEPDHPEAYLTHINLGLSYWKKGDVESATKHLRTAVRLKPDSAQAHYNLGLLYFNTGRAGEARQEFETALRIDPGYQMARRFLRYIGSPAMKAPQ